MPGPLGGAVVELPGVLKGLGRFGRPESSPDSVKKKSLSKKAQSDSLKMIVLDKKNLRFVDSVLVKAPWSKVGPVNHQPAKINSRIKRSSSHPKTFQNPGLRWGLVTWFHTYWNVMQNLDRSEWSICSWSRKIERICTHPNAPNPPGGGMKGFKEFCRAKGDCDLSENWSSNVPTDFENKLFILSSSFNSFTHTRYPGYLWRNAMKMVGHLSHLG